jgi:hypothetical protein
MLGIPPEEMRELCDEAIEANATYAPSETAANSAGN